jgi:DNA modification methylase
MIDISEHLANILQSNEPVKGLTHNFYRYPARFQPEFARAIIEEFSRKGDCIIDPFVGGGTTTIEAIALGRYSLGIDINPLAYFITKTKTTPLSKNDYECIQQWADEIDENNPSTPQNLLTTNSYLDYYFKNVPQELAVYLQNVVTTTEILKFRRQRQFAKCIILRVGQWALDCKDNIPSFAQMNNQIVIFTQEMISGLNDLVKTAKNAGTAKNKITSQREIYLGNILHVIKNKSFNKSKRLPKLVITSPPYPGVHILYHRWQINGRRETSLPYWITGLQDGHGDSYYTLGGRSNSGIQNYFMQLHDIYSSLKPVLDPSALIFQLVAFSTPDVQLPLFTNSMNAAGYEEVKIISNDLSQTNLSRHVPNRKWYSYSRNNQNASNEFLFIHKIC